jgi:hypothetical protein
VQLRNEVTRQHSSRACQLQLAFSSPAAVLDLPALHGGYDTTSPAAGPVTAYTTLENMEWPQYRPHVLQQLTLSLFRALSALQKQLFARVADSASFGQHKTPAQRIQDQGHAHADLTSLIWKVGILAEIFRRKLHPAPSLAPGAEPVVEQHSFTTRIRLLEAQEIKRWPLNGAYVEAVFHFLRFQAVFVTRTPAAVKAATGKFPSPRRDVLLIAL